MTDPIDDLKAAWNGLAAPAPTDDVQDTDEVTQATVEWLRAAFEELEAPELAPPRARYSPIDTFGLAAAAVVLALALAHKFTQESHEAAAEPVVVAIAGGDVDVDVPLLTAPIFHADGSIELKKNGVRLILLAEPKSPTTKESR